MQQMCHIQIGCMMYWYMGYDKGKTGTGKFIYSELLFLN